MNQLYVYIFPLPFEPPSHTHQSHSCRSLRAPGWAPCAGHQVPTSYLFDTWVSESISVVSDSLWPHGLYSPWDSPGQNTGVGSHSLSQGIFPTRDQTQVSHIAGGFFTSWAPREAQNVWVLGKSFHWLLEQENTICGLNPGAVLSIMGILFHAPTSHSLFSEP